jgi:hypothetical protein
VRLGPDLLEAAPDFVPVDRLENIADPSFFELSSRNPSEFDCAPVGLQNLALFIDKE